MRARMGVLVAVVVCGLLYIGPASAGAQTPTTATSFTNIPVTGKVGNHKTFTGRYTVNYFTTRGNTTYAVGKLTGRIGKRHVSKQNVRIPVSLGGASTQTAATCQILNLTLGPLNLNLLGLRVHLNQVHLQITGVTGPGNLLGNLLCGLANLLNTTPAQPASNLSGLLNMVLQLVNTPALGNL